MIRTAEENREIVRQRMAAKGRPVGIIRRIGEDSPPRLPPEQLYPCRYRLPVIIEKTDAAGIECSCPGKWLRGCEIHGQCRIDQESVDGCCRTCEQRPTISTPRAAAQ